MVEIYTLGNFDIRFNDVSILQSIGSKHRLIKLFKYLLTFEGKKLLPEDIIEDLSQDEYAEPLNALRTQISRVRGMFPLETYGVVPFFSIDFIDGYYIFKLSIDCFVDFIYMQKCIQREEIQGTAEQYDNCEEIVRLYKGRYLGELGDQEWLIPVRNRFDRLYIKNLTKYLQYLMNNRLFNRVLTICEEAIIYKPYEEILHIYYMEALEALGENKSAINHYSYCTTRLYRELGESPSDRMKDFYKRVKINNNHNNHNNHNSIIHMDSLSNDLHLNNDRGSALVCDMKQFEFIYNYEKSLLEREKWDVFLGILTLDHFGVVRNDGNNFEENTRQLINSMQYNLRKGDVLAQWNCNQALILLKASGECDIKCVIERIQNCFQNVISNENIALNIKLRKI
ncbi:bacterial transcriptional activator domain-containing protein [Gudongella sp. DL1XJH-153]|uniref:bacterial transcriptional activator domain-containing protein n=1 Tax=Gudongella sp. DL1XJH-153 TaxID=3409804 RepID=UPI003BB4B8F0